jgi:hypothetical protein
MYKVVLTIPCYPHVSGMYRLFYKNNQQNAYPLPSLDHIHITHTAAHRGCREPIPLVSRRQWGFGCMQVCDLNVVTLNQPGAHMSCGRAWNLSMMILPQYSRGAVHMIALVSNIYSTSLIALRMKCSISWMQNMSCSSTICMIIHVSNAKELLTATMSP